MASYTQITLNEAQEILHLYGRSGVKSCTPLSLGISNSNYRVELESETVLLKISNDKNQEQLAAEQAILIYLKNQNYPYSLKPFPLLDGSFIYQYGQYFGVLYPFVQGIPPGPSDYTCQEVGKAIARLHTISQDKDQLNHLRAHEQVGYGAREIADYVKTKQCPEDFKKIFTQLFPDELREFLKTPFNKGIIHGDLYYDNTLFDHNKISTVLDFEQAGLGEYILDLGISISGTCLEKGRVITPLVNSYLSGYEALRPMPSEEKKFLDQAIMLGLFSISLWRIKRFKERNLNPLMENSYQDLLVRAQHYFEMKKEMKI
ncbi:MAG: phosphotransferase [Bacteriovoracaceae bacterium]|nr:phosphotransferase [Bacteriovoracaceae bacterium]